MKELVNNYFDWLKEKILVDEFVLNESENLKALSISVPFLDRHNDYLQIDIVKNNDNELMLQFETMVSYPLHLLNKAISIGNNYDLNFSKEIVDSAEICLESFWYYKCYKKTTVEKFNEHFNHFLQAVILISNLEEK
jgi:hypothetical protein